jgi:pre-mRNA-splicing factor SPF27
VVDIDDAVSQDARDRAAVLIGRELRHEKTQELHSGLPIAQDVTFSDLMSKELERIRAGGKMPGGIDTARYEAPDEVSPEDSAETWRNSLRSAYISGAYLEGRHVNLQLLEEFGKNAWLVGNSQLDSLLKDLDSELSQLKEEVDSVNRERKLAQESSKGEILSLEDTWRKGIGRVIEVQLATEQLRQELRQRPTAK